MNVSGQFGDLVRGLVQGVACVDVPLLLPLLLILLRVISLLGRPLPERGPGKREEEQGPRRDKLQEDK